jgi:MFS family permease
MRLTRFLRRNVLRSSAPSFRSALIAKCRTACDSCTSSSSTSAPPKLAGSAIVPALHGNAKSLVRYRAFSTSKDNESKPDEADFRRCTPACGNKNNPKHEVSESDGNGDGSMTESEFIESNCPWRDTPRAPMQQTAPFTSRFLDEMNLRTVPPKGFNQAVNEAFDNIDTDQDGHITRRELKAILRNRIYRCSADCANELDAELKQLGVPQSGQKVSRDEFLRIVNNFAEKLDDRVWPVVYLSGIGGLCFAMSGTLTPVLSKEMGIAAGTYGMIIAMMPLVRVGSTIPTTIAAETLGRKPLMTCGTGMITVGFALNAVIASPIQFLIARVVSGVGTGALSVGTQNYIADISTAKNRARSYAPGNMVSSVGFAIGPTLAGISCDLIGTRNSFWLLCAGMAASTTISQMLLPETLRKTVDAGLLTRTKDKTKHTLSESKDMVREAFAKWKVLLQDKPLRQMVFASCGINMTSITARYVLLPMVALNHWDFSPTQLGFLLGGMSLVQAVAQYPSAYISDRLGRMAAFAPGMALMSVSLAAASFVDPSNSSYLVRSCFFLGC